MFIRSETHRLSMFAGVILIIRTVDASPDVVKNIVRHIIP